MTGKNTWYEALKMTIDKSKEMSPDLLNNIYYLLEQAEELHVDKALIKTTMQDLNNYFSDKTNQVIGVSWQDKVYYDLYKLCNENDFHKGKEYFKSLISTQSFVILAGKDLVGVVDKKIGDGVEMAVEQAKNIGGMIKEGFEVLLNKANDKDTDNKKKK